MAGEISSLNRLRRQRLIIGYPISSLFGLHLPIINYIAAMESTTSCQLDVNEFKSSVKMYEHVKSHMKKGMIQLACGQDGATFLDFICGIGNAGILTMKMNSAFNSISVSPDDMPLSLSFRNQSFGHTFLHTRELFGGNIEKASIKFYKRNSSPKSEFVETTIEYDNHITTTNHKSVVEPFVPPVNKQVLKNAMTGKILLTNKTLTLLQKWLRSLKTKKNQSVKISINATMSVIVFTVGAECKTIGYKPTDAAIDTAFNVIGKIDKASDAGVVYEDITTFVSLESLLTALSACKIPGVCVPVIACFNNELIEVIGAPFSENGYLSSTVSAILLKIDECGDLEESEDEEAANETEGHSQISSPTASVSCTPPPHNNEVKDYQHKEPCVSREEPKPCQLSIPSVKQRHREEKHKRKSSDKGDHRHKHQKKQKLSFNPMI